MSTIMYNPSYRGNVVLLRPQSVPSKYAVPILRTPPSSVPTYQAPPTTLTPPVTSTSSLSSDEQAMINLVNQQRSIAGVPPVAIDPRLISVARTKAQDMKTNNYFSHISPTYGTPWAMMQAAGLNVKWGAENLTTHRNVAGAMANFMASPAHRANIIDPRMTHIGVAVAYKTSYGNIYVQEFLQE